MYLIVMDFELMNTIENIYLIHMLTMLLFFMIMILLFLNYRNYRRMFKFIKIEFHKKKIKQSIDKFVGYALTNAGDNTDMKYFIFWKAQLLYQFAQDVIDTGITKMSEKVFTEMFDFYFNQIRLQLRLHLSMEFEVYCADSKNHDQKIFKDLMLGLIRDGKNSKNERFIEIFQRFCQDEIIGIAGIYSNFVLNYKIK